RVERQRCRSENNVVRKVSHRELNQGPTAPAPLVCAYRASDQRRRSEIVIRIQFKERSVGNRRQPDLKRRRGGRVKCNGLGPQYRRGAEYPQKYTKLDNECQTG